MQPFVDIVVQPSYGQNSCLVRWNVLPGFEGGDFFVYRSEDGQTNWKLLHAEEQPVRGRTWFEDTDFVVRDLLTTMHYRLLLEHQGNEYDSPVVGIFDKLNRKEFGIVRRILQLELRNLREGRQGIEVQVFTPLTRGRTCRCVDPITKQARQASLCPYCYGTRIEGGYSPAVSTWITVQRWNANAKVDDPTGKAREDDNRNVSRALAIPQLATDDLVVHAPTDTRLVVGRVTFDYFRGMVPVTCRPELIQLPRMDIRYKLPIA